MTLWRVHREEWGYDEYDAFVIRAATAEEALAIAVENEASPGTRRYDQETRSYVLVSPVEWKFVPVEDDGPAGVILASFNAG